MPNRLTIVMYHYVRPLEASRYPRLKALELEHFRGQLDYIQRHYRVVSMEQVIAASRDARDALPAHPLLLTFDDGYRDHHDHVLPLLTQRGLQGSFFPPACAVLERRVLDVNKIHFILASVEDPGVLVDFIFSAMDEARVHYGLEPNHVYFSGLSSDSRYDDPPTTFVKRALQRELPEDFRQQLTERLFSQYVTSDEKAFAEELYMSEGQLRHLLEAGMFIGSHGDQHYWLNSLSPAHQIEEVERGLRFLEVLGACRDDWVMCYPYGGYDDSLLSILRARGCALGLTTEVALADLTANDPLILPRIDTNDLPTDVEAPPPMDFGGQGREPLFDAVSRETS
ncbi:polysaccharide deacetylase family protein [Litchfieldella rifensis]|uniref:Polysaccharide deacetylase family protein n=1 Tax=Litchfieldella rifensis TaxID=762643 RepID=A0ABV7LUC1_9GAMM